MVLFFQEGRSQAESWRLERTGIGELSAVSVPDIVSGKRRAWVQPGSSTEDTSP